ncbi:MAG: L-threonylcarbamoyladenylate synthase [Euryarchaeota archaeon]|nr:L-threonylcarbamoyladenylate synthase [Euryarchaeota archaeon]
MSIDTRIFRITDNTFDEVIKEASQIIREGGTVAFPTETVYGLGADALNPDAVLKIFEAKGRPADNPLIVHIADRKQCIELALDIPEMASRLMDTFWPGPLTLILKCKTIVPYITTGGLDTVGLRMPDDRIALELIRCAGTPIAAPSANRSGYPSPTTAEHVIQDLEGRIDAVIDGGDTNIGVESTVVDVTANIPVILRPGYISAEDIEQCAGTVHIGYTDRQITGNESVRSPGMKYTHYSPKADVIMIEGDFSDVAYAITGLIAEYYEKGQRVGLLVSDEVARTVSADATFSLGRGQDPSQAARSIFMGLRHLDNENMDLIIVDGSITNEGVGTAVFNRLRKAADRIIKI